LISHRLVRPDEGPAVASVFGAARAEMTYLPSLHTPAEDIVFFSDIVRSGCWMAVAEAVGGELVGFCVVRAGWVEHLYVRPGYQGQGVGGALLSRAMAENEGELLLWVFEENTGAQRFYARAGFYEIERTDGSDNEERAPDIKMRRDPPRSLASGTHQK
jgi:putative acetyltransferase